MNFEEYLKEKAVTKLRISSHRLPVESRHYNSIPFDERIPMHCNLNEVGNEQHYLMQCSNLMFEEIKYMFCHDIVASFDHLLF